MTSNPRKSSFCFSAFIFSIALAAFTLSVSAKDYLRPGPYVSADSEGIKFRCFKNANPMPLASAMSYKMKNTRTGEKFEMYDPDELWFRDQCVGRWGNVFGSVALGKMTLPPPFEVLRPFRNMQNRVFMKNYEQWLEREREKKHKWDKTAIREWLETFAGAEIEPKPEKVNSYGDVKIYCFKIKKQENGAYKEIYLVINPKNPEHFYALLYKVDSIFRKKIDTPQGPRSVDEPMDKKDLERSIRAVHASAKSITIYAPVKKENEKRLSLGKSKGEMSSDYLESRKRAIENIKNLAGWWYLPTQNYIIISNMKRKNFIKDLQNDIECCRTMYSAVYPMMKEPKEVSVVRVFSERNEYERFAGKGAEWTVGFWQARKKELAVSPPSMLKGKRSRDFMLKTLYHEAFHQYIYYATGLMSTAVWFNEGSATFCEGIEIKGKKISVDIPEHHFNGFKHVMQTPMCDISRLINMDYNEYYSEENRNWTYPLSWALMYFLIKGAPVMRDKEAQKYAEIPLKYYKSAVETGDPVKATAIAWSGIDMRKFHEHFRKFWNSNRLLKKSKRYDPLEDAEERRKSLSEKGQSSFSFSGEKN